MCSWERSFRRFGWNGPLHIQLFFCNGLGVCDCESDELEVGSLELCGDVIAALVI